MKIWTSNEKGDDKVIAFSKDIIYKGNSKLQEADKVVFELKALQTIPRTLVGVPLSYIKEIILQEGKGQIELVLTKDSSEDLKISDEKTRREIFEYFKNNIPNSGFSVVKYSALKAGKKPLIAFGVVTGIFIWTLYIALGMEAGNEYDVSGQRYNSVAGIVVAMASIGVKNVILIFGSLMAIALFSFIKKAKNPPTINRIFLRR